jgi:hypothetical protein
MTDWNALARIRNPDLPADVISDNAVVLEALEAAFRPLLKQLPDDMEPAVILSESAMSGE